MYVIYVFVYLWEIIRKCVNNLCFLINTFNITIIALIIHPKSIPINNLPITHNNNFTRNPWNRQPAKPKSSEIQLD